MRLLGEKFALQFFLFQQRNDDAELHLIKIDALRRAILIAEYKQFQTRSC